MSPRAKQTELIEAEGKILKLSYDPDAPAGAAAARVQIFDETTSVNLDAADLVRVRKALNRRAAKGAR
jgi:hypothetical protein